MPRGKKIDIPSDLKQFADEQEAKVLSDYQEYLARNEKSKLTELIVTDTIPMSKHSDKIRVITVSELFGDVIKRLINNESISSHFVIS